MSSTIKTVVLIMMSVLIFLFLAIAIMFQMNSWPGKNGVLMFSIFSIVICGLILFFTARTKTTK